MKKYLLVSFLFLMGLFGAGFGQGLNHNFLIGYNAGIDTNVISNKAVLGFGTNSLVISPDSFPVLSLQKGHFNYF